MEIYGVHILSLLAALVGAALLVLLFQKLFPLVVRWPMALAAVGFGVVLTLVLLGGFAVVLPDDLAERLKEPLTHWQAFQFVFLYAGLPEETVKILAAFAAMAFYRFKVRPDEAFRCLIFAALGFAAIENIGYGRALSGDAGILLTAGRSVSTSLIHPLIAIIQAAFLWRFVETGWRRWHLPVIGWLAAALAHALFDWGLVVPAMAQLHGGANGEQAMIDAVMTWWPVIVVFVPLPLILGLWLLRRAIRKAAADPAMSGQGQSLGSIFGPDAAVAVAARLDRSRQRIVWIWKRTGTVLMILGPIVLIAALGIDYWINKADLGGAADATPKALDLSNLSVGSMLLTGAVAAGPLILLYGWIVRQKR